MNFHLSQQKNVKVTDCLLGIGKACIVKGCKEVRESCLALMLLFPGRGYEVCFINDL